MKPTRARSTGGLGWAGAMGLALLAATACEGGHEASIAENEQASVAIPNDVVLDWNEHTIAALTTHDGYQDPVFATRVLSMVHVAMHDALNATAYHFYQSYAYSGRDRWASPVAAAASAAERVLVRVFPTQEADLRHKLEVSLAGVRNGKAERRGIALGEAVGDAIVALREDDGSNVNDPYTPGTGPGAYQFTTPDFIYRPGWENVTPWGLERADQFRPEPPPALDSEAYAEAYEEVRIQGDVNSETRSPDESAYAQFWYELSDLGWNRVTHVVAQQEGLGLAASARLFALVNMALADAYIAGWDGKFFYDTWRPITAIHAGDEDGNPTTVADPHFEPFLPTPPVQDYPSTHSTLGAAAAEVLTRYFGQRGKRIGFSMTSSTASEPNVEVRSFESFAQAARENADSRVAAGIHFRFACDAGMELGAAVGAHVFANYLRPLR